MFKAYSEYKQSSLPWLDVAPAHWEEIRTKGLYQKEDRPVLGSDDVVTCFRDGVVTLRKNRRTTGFTESLKEIGYQGIRKGDLVIHAMDAFAGAIGVSDSDGKGTPVYNVCTAKKDINNHYYAHILREMAKRGFIQSLYRGIRERSSDFRFETFARQYLPVPPRPEQDQIVRFLDSKLSKIAKLINAKKKQIALLKEQKQAIINKAVTKGLDSGAKMKPSGVEWLGEIPCHWEIVKLRGILSPVSIKNRPELPLLSVVREEGIILRDKEDKESNHNFIPDDLSGYKVVQKGQFVINKMKSWQGSYGISSFQGIVSPAYFVFDVDFNNLDYFHHAIRSKVYVSVFAQSSDGIRTDQWDLSMQKMKEILFFVPSKEEQKQIISYIEQKSVGIDKAISATEREIAIISEYRTRLISDAVTGKIDVRDVDVADADIEQEIEMDEAEENEDEKIPMPNDDMGT